MELSHIDSRGAARMVDVTTKEETVREAVARGRVRMLPETLRLIEQNALAKGDVLSVARLAGLMAAKETGRLIPLCHPLPLTGCSVDFNLNAGMSAVEIEARVRTASRTGVEMEALTAVAVAALAIYDMAKAVDRGMVIEDICLVAKSGGRSGTYRRPDDPVSTG